MLNMDGKSPRAELGATSDLVPIAYKGVGKSQRAGLFYSEDWEYRGPYSPAEFTNKSAVIFAALLGALSNE